jgi:hypothetical protein
MQLESVVIWPRYRITGETRVLYYGVHCNQKLLLTGVLIWLKVMSSETFYTLLVAILSSSLLAAAFTSLASGFFSVYVKAKEYENEYFKEVIKRRLEAYEFIEAQISLLKSASYDNDGRAYHLIFAFGEDKFYEYQRNLGFAISKSVWINDRTKTLLIELSRLFLKISNDYDLERDLILAGKDYYQAIALFRERLESSFSNDLLDLHKIRKFFKQKKEDHEFHLIEVKSKDKNESKNKA